MKDLRDLKDLWKERGVICCQEHGADRKRFLVQRLMLRLASRIEGAGLGFRVRVQDLWFSVYGLEV